MAYLNDLSRGNLAEIERRLRRLEHKATLTNAAIGRDGMEVYDEGILNISNGTLIVNGYAQISGSLEVSGTSTFSGSLTIAGPTGITGHLTIQGITDIAGALNVTGPTTLAGTVDITGDTTLAANLDVTTGGKITAGSAVINPDGSATFGLFDIAANGDLASKGALSIEGPTTLKNDLEVVMGGKVRAGNLELDPANGGQINFLNGSISSHEVLGLLINNTLRMQLSSEEVTLEGPGGIDFIGNTKITGFLDVSATSIFRGIGNFTSQLRNTGRLTTGSAANVHMNTGGYFYEVTSSQRFKLDVQPLELPDSLLDVPIVDWVDRTAQENYDRLNTAPRPFEYQDQVDFDNADLTRIPGALAEAVDAAGGRAFVTYGDDGLPRALAYDRFALARTELLARRLNAAIDRIDGLVRRLSALEGT